jgi:Bacterial Ig-like domain (group 2)
MRTSVFSSAGLGYVCLALLFGCKGDSSGPIAVATIIVTPALDSIDIGETIQYTAVVKHADGNTLTDREVSWTSNNDPVATVAPTGVVTGVAPGGPVVISAASGGKFGTGLVKVLAPNPCALANAMHVTVPQTINGSLSTSDCLQTDGSWSDVYQFTLTTTTNVSVLMTSDAFDTFEVLGLVQGTSILVVDFDDDAGGGTNSLMVNTLPAGTYVIVAGSFDPAVTGAYQLAITTTAAGTAAGAAVEPAVRPARSASAGNIVAALKRKR